MQGEPVIAPNAKRKLKRDRYVLRLHLQTRGVRQSQPPAPSKSNTENIVIFKTLNGMGSTRFHPRVVRLLFPSWFSPVVQFSPSPLILKKFGQNVVPSSGFCSPRWYLVGLCYCRFGNHSAWWKYFVVE